MAWNSQPLLRRVRATRPPDHDTPHPGPFGVLYLPTSARDGALVKDRLSRAGAVVTLAADLADALQTLSARRFALMVVDLATDRSALTNVRLLRAQAPALPLVAVTDPAYPILGSEALDAGASDVLTWPFDDQDLAGVLASVRDTIAVDPSPGRVELSDRLFDHSPAMRSVSAAMKAAAARGTAVLIAGENGSGRHLVARTLHERDHDYLTRPMVVIDCAADGPHELERRLFGVMGEHPADTSRASTPERATRDSALLAAQGGSLLLKGLTEAPARVQARLAQVLRDREVFSADVNEVIALTIRPIGIVGADVDAAIADGRLRRDLVERLAQVRIDVPPLRRRREDVALLAAHLLRRACDAEGTGTKRFSRAALTLFLALPWRGNAAELQDVIRAAVRATRQPVIQLDDVLEHVRFDAGSDAPGAPSLTLRDARARFERECISAALMRHHGRVGDAAKSLGIQRTNLYRKVRQLKISRTLLTHRK
jgi:two-component system response regulator HydG